MPQRLHIKLWRSLGVSAVLEGNLLVASAPLCQYLAFESADVALLSPFSGACFLATSASRSEPGTFALITTTAARRGFRPFRNAHYRIQRFFWALRLNSNSFSCPSQEAALLTRA